MDKKLPLSGVTVIELATVVAAPTAGRLMSDFGADVIKIETPPEGDLLRSAAKGHRFPTEDDNEPLFDLYNSGKRLITLNLKSADGQEIMAGLLRKADVFLTNVRMKSLIKMGLGYEELHGRYPELIYAHFSGFGLKGPESDSPGFDSTAFWMRSGSMLDTLLPGSFPIRPAFGMGDMTSASAFLSGILMALYAKKCGQGGTMVSSSLLGAGMWYNASYIMNAQQPYARPYPVDRYEPWDPFSDYYQCADGEWIAVMEKVYEKDKQVFARIFAMPELLTDPRLETRDTMRANGLVPVITKKVEKILRTRTSSEWMAILQENDIPTERIRHFHEIPGDQQAWENGFLEKVPYPDQVQTVVPVPPIYFSEYDRRDYSTGGGVGRDNDAVLAEMGYTPEQIRKFREKRTI